MNAGERPQRRAPDLLRPVQLDQPTLGTMAARGIWGVVGTASQGGLRFVANMLVGRTAGPVALGVFQGAISVALLLSLLWPTSIGSAAAKFLARSRGAGKYEETRAIAAHLGWRNLQVTAVLAAVAAAWWYVHERHAGPVDILSIALLLSGYSGYAFTRGVQYGVGQVRRGTQWDLISSGLGLTGMVVLLLFGVRSLALLLPLAASYGVYAFACWPHGARSTLRTDLRREIDAFVTLAAVGSVVSTGFLQLAMIVAKSVAAPKDAGLFAAAMTLATPASLLAGSLSLVLFPTMAESWGRGNRDQFQTQTDLATRGLFSVMVAIFGSLALSSPLIVDVLWGERFAASGVVLPILLGAVCLTTLGVSSVNAIMTSTRRGMLVTTGGGVMGVTVGGIVWLVAIPAWGILGIAVGYLAGTSVTFTISFVVCWRQGGHHWGMLSGRTLTAMILVAGLCAWSARSSWGMATQAGISVAFLAAWAAVSLPDLRRAIPRRARTPA
jgi:O-antigen/teichoic acid export membrane protein